jgi:hypothetical protein
MPIILFTPCSGYLLREEFLERGWTHFVEVETGYRILLIDGDEDGAIPKMEEALQVMKDDLYPDLVVCCWPNEAAHVYRDLSFVNDPDNPGPVDVYYFPHWIVVTGAVDEGSNLTIGGQ